MEYKAVFLDIDGTILMPDHSYSASTVEAIKQLKAQDIHVFIATGRPLHEIFRLGAELGIENYIGYNGASAIYEGKEIVHKPLDKQIIQQFLKMAKNKQHEMVLYTNRQNYFTAMDDPVTKAFIDTFQMKENTRALDLTKAQILGVTLMKLQDADASEYELTENIHLSQVNVPGMQHAYDVIRNNVNKGEAIKKVLQQLNLKKEQTIAFGDGMNDKEMLTIAGTGFAMGNADPKLLPYASHRTTEVTEDGIFNGLKQLGLVR
ncbi:HAD family phosphatase [Ralstonia pickettii]|nr:HAD family phosphatase [Ralstonia pickettii]